MDNLQNVLLCWLYISSKNSLMACKHVNMCRPMIGWRPSMWDCKARRLKVFCQISATVSMAYSFICWYSSTLGKSSGLLVFLQVRTIPCTSSILIDMIATFVHFPWLTTDTWNIMLNIAPTLWIRLVLVGFNSWQKLQFCHSLLTQGLTTLLYVFWRVCKVPDASWVFID